MSGPLMPNDEGRNAYGYGRAIQKCLCNFEEQVVGTTADAYALQMQTFQVLFYEAGIPEAKQDEFFEEVKKFGQVEPAHAKTSLGTSSSATSKAPHEVIGTSPLTDCGHGALLELAAVEPKNSFVVAAAQSGLGCSASSSSTSLDAQKVLASSTPRATAAEGASRLSFTPIGGGVDACAQRAQAAAPTATAAEGASCLSFTPIGGGVGASAQRAQAAAPMAAAAAIGMTVVFIGSPVDVGEIFGITTSVKQYKAGPSWTIVECHNETAAKELQLAMIGAKRKIELRKPHGEEV